MRFINVIVIFTWCDPLLTGDLSLVRYDVQIDHLFLGRTFGLVFVLGFFQPWFARQSAERELLS